LVNKQVFGACVAIIFAFGLAVIIPSSESAIPPTNAFANFKTSNGTITANDFNSTLTISGGNNIQITSNQTTNTITITSSIGGMSELLLWRTDATASVANQGAGLPSNLTELDTSIKGTRKLIDASDLQDNIQCHASGQTITASEPTTITVTIRDTTDTTNILCTLSFGASQGTNFAVKSNFATKPSWFAGNKILGVYTSGGDGAINLIFSDVSIRSKS
jgi:hypothetical protein